MVVNYELEEGDTVIDTADLIVEELVKEVVSILTQY
jgi:hypothetical protein